MKHTQLVTALALRLRKRETEIEAFINALRAELIANLRLGDIVVITNLGTFYVGKFTARLGRNPRTGAPIQIAGRKLLKLRPARSANQAL